MADAKWIAGLTPNLPVAEAAQRVLTARFAVVEHYLPLACEKPYEDVEHVHQLRVGTRRANAALRVFAEVLPRKLFKNAKRTLRTLRRAAGAARDWDVFLLALPTIPALRAAAAKPALDCLVGYACGQRAAAQEQLVAVAADAGPLWAELARELLTRIRPPSEPALATTAHLGELATQQLGALFRTFTADVEANPQNPSELHALRIAAKRLRYAIEIFADCFPPLVRDRIYPAVERVQELLGDIQDAAVGLDRLGHIRAMLQALLPQEWSRVRKGFEGLTAVLKARIPAGRKAFRAWRKQWLDAMHELKLAIAASVAIS